MNKTKKNNVKKLPPEELVELLAKRIKDLRLKRGFTSYEAFANEHNLSRALYGRYEKGRDLRFTSLIKVIQAFDMSLEEFFSEGFE